MQCADTDTEYGAGGRSWTGDAGPRPRVARASTWGMVWGKLAQRRQTYPHRRWMSLGGIGPDGRRPLFDFYTETKNIAVAYGTERDSIVSECRTELSFGSAARRRVSPPGAFRESETPIAVT